MGDRAVTFLELGPPRGGDEIVHARMRPPCTGRPSSTAPDRGGLGNWIVACDHPRAGGDDAGPGHDGDRRLRRAPTSGASSPTSPLRPGSASTPESNRATAADDIDITPTSPKFGDNDSRQRDRRLPRTRPVAPGRDAAGAVHADGRAGAPPLTFPTTKRTTFTWPTTTSRGARRRRHHGPRHGAQPRPRRLAIHIKRRARRRRRPLIAEVAACMNLNAGGEFRPAAMVQPPTPRR